MHIKCIAGNVSLLPVRCCNALSKTRPVQMHYAHLYSRIDKWPKAGCTPTEEEEGATAHLFFSCCVFYSTFFIIIRPSGNTLDWSWHKDCLIVSFLQVTLFTIEGSVSFRLTRLH